MPEDKAPDCAGSNSTGINRKGRKFAQVLEGARTVFLKDGFELANVDEIARTAGVSKATLYSYFPDKGRLFMEVTRCECERLAQNALQEIREDAPPEQVLAAAALTLNRLLLTPVAQRMFRICVAERDRFPELAADYYRSGPEMGRKRIEAYLRAATARGELQIEKFGLAAEQFTDLARSRLWLRSMLGVQDEFSEDELRETAQEAVTTFLARYAPHR
ncbi:TetR/AcrR family transcriptional regulator [Rhodalgimonas zhirmunskyi]|uniref:TetR/AcrR family transcriptional regulator n=1 Tax=Rhodalgimonas zhirmunskyi TaxID=2964767 RepID=A0AAJ1U8Z1_9RHOB|nr:TetR/AcrR family transcriptional regulator [Rhodoalgimonas zhirmunskyi]MDQ2095800.1 TetR/AcrR family transcriptional regulator [Rhodoalgimonas zhirmunskyi]